MIQMMMSTLGGTQRPHALRLRKLVGFGIVSSGLAVMVAQALQHLLGV